MVSSLPKTVFPRKIDLPVTEAENKSSVILSVRVAPEVKKAFLEFAAKSTLTKRSIMEEALTFYLKNHDFSL